MKRCIVSLFAVSIIFLSWGHSTAQLYPFARGVWPRIFNRASPFSAWEVFSPFPFSTPFPGIIAPLSLLPPLLIMPRINIPRPALRGAAATVTILFNPTQSIIQVTVLPIGTPLPVVPTVVVPPPITPTVLPALTALIAAPVPAGPPYSYNPTASPTVKRLTTTSVLPGLTALLPLLTLI